MARFESGVDSSFGRFCDDGSSSTVLCSEWFDGPKFMNEKSSRYLASLSNFSFAGFMA